MQYKKMLEKERELCSTIEGRAQLTDMVWVIVDYVKVNNQLPPEHWRKHLQQGMKIRRSKVDETIHTLDTLAKKRYYEKLCSNPFKTTL